MPAAPSCLARFAAGLSLLAAGLSVGRAADPAPTFERDVLPVLASQCLRCHGDKVQKAGLDLRSPAAVLRGGETGPAVTPGSPEQSPLWEKVTADKMPPGKEKLSAAQK